MWRFLSAEAPPYFEKTTLLCTPDKSLLCPEGKGGEILITGWGSIREPLPGLYEYIIHLQDLIELLNFDTWFSYPQHKQLIGGQCYLMLDSYFQDVEHTLFRPNVLISSKPNTFPIIYWVKTGKSKGCSSNRTEKEELLEAKGVMAFKAALQIL